MKSFLKFMLVFTGIILLSAFLAPILFKFLPFKFERIFNRLVMVFSLIAVLALVKIRLPSLEKYGLVWGKQSGPDLFRAFLLGFLTLVVMSGLKIALGVSVLSIRDIGMWGWTKEIVESLGAAFLIGVIEEFFFRGFIYLSLHQRFRWSLLASLVGTNIFYALLHFISDETPFIGPNPGFTDSLKLVTAPLMSMKNIGEIWPGIIGLFILGMVLSAFFLKTRSLYASIGLHAGCVFFVKTDGLFVDNFTSSWLYGSSKSYDGLLPWCFLGVIWLISKKLLKEPVGAKK